MVNAVRQRRAASPGCRRDLAEALGTRRADTMPSSHRHRRQPFIGIVGAQRQPDIRPAT